MTDNLSQADRFLLDEIRRGSADGWQQLVERYEGRLMAFARRKLGACSDAEDLVQETFINFLHGLARFRGDAAIDTYLFLILRRKIAGWLRGHRKVESLQEGSASGSEHAICEPAGDDPTASWYARRDEAHEAQQRALSGALGEIIADLRKRREFKELMVVEAIFYAQLRNTETAEITGVRDNYVAVTKHRLLARLQGRVRELLAGQRSEAGDEFELPDALLTQIWQEGRLSCLKRSTLGSYLLEALEDPWQEYVRFHLEQLDCAFCRAELEDMQTAIADAPAQQLRTRILESTVGFLRQSGV